MSGAGRECTSHGHDREAGTGTRGEGHGISRASRSTGLQRAGAGQELDGSPTWAAGCWWWPALAGLHEVVLVAGLGVGVVAGIEGRRRAPGRRPRDQPGQPIDRAAACRRWPGTRRPGPRGRPVPGASSSCSDWAAWSVTRPASGPAPARNSTSAPTWAAGCWCRPALAGMHEVVLVAGLGVGAVAGIEGRRRAPGRRPRDQPGQQIDRAAACRRWPGPRGCPAPGTSSSCSGWAAWSGTRPASVPTCQPQRIA
jgi:hypothetical protein